MPQPAFLGASASSSQDAAASPPWSARRRDRRTTSSLAEQEGGGEGGGSKFSLSNLFSGDGGAASGLRGARSRSGSAAVLEPHPSQRDHINPLNTLHRARDGDGDGGGDLPRHPLVRSGVLPNGLSWVFLPNRSPPGRFEAHLP